MMPNDHTSDGAEWSAPWMRSGAMYAAVPTNERAIARDSSSSLDMPKSATAAAPVESIRIFAGFRSRCTSRHACKCCSPQVTCVTTPRSTCSGSPDAPTPAAPASAWYDASSRSSEPPSMYRSAMYT